MECGNNFDNQHLTLEQKNETVTASNDDLAAQRRLAKLVAAGEIPIPNNLSHDETNRLVLEVSRLRKIRLIRYIARDSARYGPRRKPQTRNLNMLNTPNDTKQRYRVVIYLRNSDDMQNRRSSGRQLEEIKRRLKLFGLIWSIAKICRERKHAC